MASEVTPDGTGASPSIGAQRAGRGDFEELAAEIEAQILGGPPQYTLAELASGAGMPPPEANTEFMWLGFPIRDLDRPHFTEYERVLLSEYLGTEQIQEFDDITYRSLIRALGFYTERLAAWQVEAVIENLMRRERISDTEARELALDLLPRLAPVFAKVVESTWRRQFAAAAIRNTVDVISERGGADPGVELPLSRAVGMVDAVGFTKKVSRLNYPELSSFLEGLSVHARDVIADSGGRLIKTAGDAALFVADDAFTGTDICLKLLAQLDRHSGVELRGGLVWCRVLGRYGDIFGPGVNLSARLCSHANPGQLLVDPPTAKLLATSPKYTLVEQDEMDLHGVGAMRPVQVRFADAAGGEFTI